ncbi:MAG: hypothetical protein KJ574_01690 [Nanoarchaeota archaeon]|nr:hypothetical protein [Nanoarchaeota archaeon]
MNLRVKAVRSELAKELMIRKRKSHKIDNRTVLIVGENRELVGAPALADLASLRAGADLTFNRIDKHSDYFVKQMQLLRLLRIYRRRPQ